MDIFQIAPEIFVLFAEYSHIHANSENQVFATANSRSTYTQKSDDSEHQHSEECHAPTQKRHALTSTNAEYKSHQFETWVSYNTFLGIP